MDHRSNGIANDTAPVKKEFSLVEVASTILRHWRIVFALPLALGFVVGVWSLMQERSVRAAASFLPQAQEGSTSTAAALAQQFGVSLGFDKPGTSPQFYVDLLTSPSLLRKVVESQYDYKLEDGTARRATLIDIYEIPPDGRLPQWRLAVDQLKGNIVAGYEIETGVVEFTVSADQGPLAEQIATRLLDILNDFNMEVRRRTATEESRFIAARVKEVEADLHAAENNLQRFLMQNREFRNSPELTFQHDRLQRQVAVRQEVYTTLLRSQEQVQIDGVRDTPLFTVIEHPVGSATPMPRGTVRRTMLAVIIGMLLALFVVFLRDWIQRGSESDAEEYREFRGVFRQAWHDVRRPHRWLARDRKKVLVAAGDNGGGPGSE